MKRPGLEGAFWPSATEEAILRTSLLRGDPAVAAWRSVEASVDIDGASGELIRILPLLGDGLRADGIESPVLPRLRGMRRKTWLFNQILLDRAGEIVRELDAAGIPSILLKGCAIAVRYYPDVGLRPMGDIDVMVPPEHVRAALDRLVRAGWADSTERRPGGEVFRNTHAYYLVAGDGMGCDLHWSIGEHMLLGRGEDPTKLFWPPAERLVIGPVTTLGLCPTDQLLHVILHGAQPGSPSRLQWIADAVKILRTSEIDWARLEELTIGMRDTIRISDALTYLADPYVPDRIPSATVARLRAHPVPRIERMEYAFSAQGTGPGLGMFPATLATFVRETRGWPVGRRARLFPRYLQEVWELDHVGQVPGTALRKAASTLRGRKTEPR